ncbi:MAG: TraR/DksA family transcriptional regulator [Chitinophagaceae bacterium]|nr:TraR/DksA family transcriptional regulator [Chitinophagaceae bacterium]
MASKKPAPKKAAAKKPAKPAPKKAAPAKKAAKPAPKKAPAKKPAPKKAVPQKGGTKKAAKPAPKKAVPAKKAAKPAPKPAPKKVAAPAKAAKPAPKPVPKPAVKVIPKPAPAPVKAVALPPKPVKPPVPSAPAKPVKKAPEPMKEVKVPKIATKTSVPYKPGYTQLEKRIDTVRSNGEPLVKYSDSDLNEFRDLITRKLEAAKKELAYLQGLITRKDEMGGDNDDARYMTMEDGSMSMEREQLSQMASRQITYIDHLEKALMRIENKTYGICRVTGKLIDKARLRAVPHATLSLEAKLGLVKPSSE